jgi:glucan-binding YG repeat protein
MISTATLFVLLGIAVPALAQDNHKDEGAKPAQHEKQAKPAQHEQQAKPEQRQQQATAARPEQQSKPATAERQQQAKSNNQQRSHQAQATQQQDQQQARDRNTQTQPNNQQRQASNRQEEQPRQHVQRTAAAEQRQRSQPQLRLSSRGEGRIPDARFRSSFGRGHEFRIGSPRLVGGYSRFQYGGYWFGFVQLWPVGWYYTDDVYVDYIDGGYYLCNPEYPGAQISISVVL